MRALAASPLGFLIGLSVGALGGGGSILAVPVLVYIAGQDPRAATTTSLVIVGLAALVGMTDHWRAGRVQVGPGVVFGLAGIGGSLLGSLLNRRLDPDLLLLAFAGLVLVAAWRMLTGCPSCTNVGEREAIGAGGTTKVMAGLRVDAATVTKVLVPEPWSGSSPAFSVWAEASSSCRLSPSACASPCPTPSAPPC